MHTNEVGRETALMLRLVPEWRLTADEWAAVGRALGGLRDALRAGDPGAAERELVTLAELAPTRLASLGEADPVQTGPAPEEIIDLVVEVQGS